MGGGLDGIQHPAYGSVWGTMLPPALARGFAVVSSDGGHRSTSMLDASFGLGDATTITSVEVTWPSGAHQSFTNIPADHFYQITEGHAQPVPQPISKH